MEIIYVLIPIAMIFVAIAVKSEQFDDLDRQSVSILFDEDTVKPNSHPVPEKEKAEAAQEKGMPL
jgi:cbb3-type cytochrome oxidase maturation protein